MVELQPSKLAMRVRSPSPALLPKGFRDLDEAVGQAQAHVEQGVGVVDSEPEPASLRDRAGRRLDWVATLSRVWPLNSYAMQPCSLV